ncbi:MULTISPECIES: YdcF family protein [unclassified Lactobacillus]|uniref:YdcF family protein n=1 Tax=unclassified Lactobacillus TaxID=2620435 RepID=UPI000EFC1032|nr:MULTISPECIES: ElyC/SanA/YdcF family protein [unclassified Lactobacillus]RMC23428.1 hypothetical protein F5ESL0247_07925 [Lactobacillus sp. ESL0247]RMC27018.1 hypothetical protein F5ESL0246_07925 [Lactobacillus sp. ESL0246]RMC30223.1 hypothetical protein F5ESL0245_07925 [Lactobacillus sp. ESL0245]
MVSFFSQAKSFSWLSIIVFISFVLFLTFWLIEPRRLINGIFFTFFLFLAIVWLSALILITNSHFLILTYKILIGLVISLFVLLLAFSWIFFLWNAYIVWHHESHTIGNLLTLFLGFAILISWILIIGPFRQLPSWIKFLSLAPAGIIIYLVLVAYNFLINLLLYQFVPRQYNQDYLIVLGSGLSNGKKVTPLLATRINCAIQYADKQIKKGNKAPKFIMSGGKGNDEDISEAQAMAEYAIDQGINPNLILCESRSKNTYQNMLFSSSLAFQDFGSSKYRAKFFSNNYHIFRASLIAKAAGLNANGIGCYTRFYFLPNAIMREFVGVLLINKKRHLIITIAILLFFTLATVINLIW